MVAVRSLNASIRATRTHDLSGGQLWGIAMTLGLLSAVGLVSAPFRILIVMDESRLGRESIETPTSQSNSDYPVFAPLPPRQSRNRSR